MQTFGARVAQTVPPGTGRVQLRRVLDRLALIAPGGSTVAGRRWVNQSSGGRMTVVLSPLISPEAIDLAVSFGRRGISVVVIDTLPQHVVDDDDDALTALAWRIRLLERRREIRMVGAAGIAVVEWRGPGSLDGVIRDIARWTTGARLVRR